MQFIPEIKPLPDNWKVGTISEPWGITIKFYGIGNKCHWPQNAGKTHFCIELELFSASLCYLGHFARLETPFFAP